jgi:hypothetical protein
VFELDAKGMVRFWSKVQRRGPDECWEWGGPRQKRGYGKFSIGRRTFLAHRVAAVIDGGNPERLLVMHLCDNPPCVNPRHLTFGTPLDNMRDMHRKGRARPGRNDYRGSKNPQALLTESDVLEIRRLRATGLTYSEIGRRFGQPATAMCAIVKKRAWAHVP